MDSRLIRIVFGLSDSFFSLNRGEIFARARFLQFVHLHVLASHIAPIERL